MFITTVLTMLTLSLFYTQVMIGPRCCIHPLDEGVGSTWLDRPDTLVVSVAGDLLRSVTDVAEALHDSIDGQENIHELLTNILNNPDNQNPRSSQYQTVMQSTLRKFLIPPQSLKHEGLYSPYIQLIVMPCKKTRNNWPHSQILNWARLKLLNTLPNLSVIGNRCMKTGS